MKFILHLGPVVPADSNEERRALRPIAHRTDRIQAMLGEMVELAQLAEATGFEMVTFSEHHFFSDGFIAGSSPTPHVLNLAANTTKIKIGPLGYVLPTWDPIRLAEEIAWCDQITRGRSVAGFARGVFPHWVNTLAQRYKVQPASWAKTLPNAVGSQIDIHNQEVSQEIFRIMKLSWKDEAFSYDGIHYKVPSPPEGIEWPAADAARQYGAPDEIDEGGWLKKVSPIPKPFTKPHPLLLQAMTLTEETIGWGAREGIVPMIFLPFPDHAIAGARYYQQEARKVGRDLVLGESVGLARIVAIGKNKESALDVARRGIMGLLALYHSRFYPNIPTSVEPMVDAGVLFAGTLDDIRAQFSRVQDQLNPEYFLVFCDQGLLPISEVKDQVSELGKLIPEFS